MTEHRLKVNPDHFAAILDGTKTFEVRRDDRNFAVGDILWLREWVAPNSFEGSSHYTGESLRAEVVFKQVGGEGYGVAAGHCVMQFEVQAEEPTE